MASAPFFLHFIPYQRLAAIAARAAEGDEISLVKERINLICKYTRSGEAGRQAGMVVFFYNVYASTHGLQPYKPPRRHYIRRGVFRRNGRLNREARERIRALVEMGWTPAEIARFLNLNYDLVYSFIYRYLNSSAPRRRYRKASKEEVQQILRLHAEGHSLKSIAEMLNRPISTVHYIIKRNGG